MDLPQIKEFVDYQLALFFFGCNVPFETVDNEHFKNFVRVLCSLKFDYRPPTRQTLSSKLLNKVAENVRAEKKKMLAKTNCVLLVDGWKNKSSTKLLVFTLRNIGIDQIYFSSKNISMDKEYGEILAEHIDLTIEKAENLYDAKVYAIITDNDSKIVKGGRLACNGNLWQTTCHSHSGNLLIKSFVPSEFLNRVKSIVNDFCQPRLQALLLRYGGKILKSWPETRFCYVRDTLESVYVNFDKIRAICDLEDAEVDPAVANLIYDPEFFADIRDYLNHLIPVCKLINQCQGPKFNVADGAQFWTTLELPSNRHTALIKERIGKALKDVAYAANFIHHEYQGRKLNEAQKTIAKNFLTNEMDAECQAEYIIYQQDENGYYSAMRQKLEAKHALFYWSFVRIQLKKLGEFGHKIFNIPASTALLEGFFSDWTYIHNNYRNRLSEEKSEDLVDIYYSMKHLEFGGIEKSKKKTAKKKHIEIV